MTKDVESEEPQGLHYAVASNGTFLVLDTDWAHAVVPVTEMPDLKEVEKSATWKLPNIPAELVYQVAKFFREVRDANKCEAAVLLHYGAVGWAVTVPNQKVMPAHVHWDWTADQRVPGKRCVGTMHSHVDMVAGHSGTDIDDEAQIDGLHVTLGRMDKLPHRLDIDAEIVIRGSRFEVTPDVFADGLTLYKPTKKEDPRPGRWFSYESDTMYRIADTALWKATTVPAEWHDRLEVSSWTQRFGFGFGMDDDDETVTPFRRKDDTPIM